MKIKKISIVFMLFIIIYMILSNNISCAKIGTSLEIGDYIKYGSYNGVSILWRVIKDDDENNRIMLVSDKILTLRAFDASKKKDEYGYNCWSQSNLRDWLNSQSKTELSESEWTHAKPKNPRYNNYVNQPGFLSEFSEDEINSIIKMNDSGNEDLNGNSITLLKESQLKFLIDAGYDNYKTGLTLESVEESKDDSRGTPSLDVTGNPLHVWEYWTRTPYSDNSFMERVVDSDGVVKRTYCNEGGVGVRPVVWIDSSSIQVFKSDVENQIYNVVYGPIDTTKPVIINMRLEENIIKGSLYGNEQALIDVIAKDNIDGDITSSIVIGGDIINTSMLGNYTITYNVTDNAGNKAEEVIRIVKVVNKLPQHEGYEIGTLPRDKKYFKYYIGMDKYNKIKCMLVCAKSGDNIKRLFSKNDIIDMNTHNFKECYYINDEGKIKKYLVENK